MEGQFIALSKSALILYLLLVMNLHLASDEVTPVSMLMRIGC